MVVNDTKLPDDKIKSRLIIGKILQNEKKRLIIIIREKLFFSG